MDRNIYVDLRADLYQWQAIGRTGFSSFPVWTIVYSSDYKQQAAHITKFAGVCKQWNGGFILGSVGRLYYGSGDRTTTENQKLQCVRSIPGKPAGRRDPDRR